MTMNIYLIIMYTYTLIGRWLQEKLKLNYLVYLKYFVLVPRDDSFCIYSI